MHLVAGSFAQQFNRRKGHEGSVWEHPYQCTLIQDGQHLLNCLRYVSLNMVRAGVVEHPDQWSWSDHDELIGSRSRYRILNIDRLLDSLEMDSPVELKNVYEQGIIKQLERRALRREPVWTEALAVGDQCFVEDIAGTYRGRSRFQYSEAGGASRAWAVKEGEASYSLVSTPESACKGSGSPFGSMQVVRTQCFAVAKPR